MLWESLRAGFGGQFVKVLRRSEVPYRCGTHILGGESPPGHFLWEDSVCFKTEYGGMECSNPGVPGPEVKWTVGNHSDPYNEAGEHFWGGGVTDKDEREKLMVQPLVAKWEEYEE